MSVIITTQEKFQKLDKIGPNILSGFYSDYKHRNKSSTPRSCPYTVCLPTIWSIRNRLRQSYNLLY